MKKLSSVFFSIMLFSFILSGCESSVKIQGASICETTSAGSKNFSVNISYFQDSRLENLGSDVQLRFNKIGEITFWEDNKEKLIFNIDEFDTWYSLTNLIAIAQDNEGNENFVLQKDAVNKNYIFSSNQNIEISIRVVAGNIVKNSYGTGYILTDSMPISDVFVLKVFK